MNKQRRAALPARTEAPNNALMSRPGEGFPVAVNVDQFTATDGTHVANLNIDLRRAQVPDRKYVADICAIREVAGTLKVMFGQERVDQAGLRSLLIVHLSRDAVSRFLNMVEQITNPTLAESVAAAGVIAEALAAKVNEPDQAIALGANLAFIGMTGTEACIDFYQASPFSIGSVAATKVLAIDPVVRVDLRTSLLVGMIDGFRALGIKAMELKVKG